MGKKDPEKQFTARFKLPLYEKIVKSAEANKRSIMSEIVFRLEESFKNDGDGNK